MSSVDVTSPIRTGIGTQSSRRTVRGRLRASWEHDLPACLFVFGVWLVLLLMLLHWIAKYGTGMPFGSDDWDFFAGLWSAENPWTWVFDLSGRREFVGKALAMLSWQATDGDVRTEMLVAVAVQAAAALGLAFAARSVRGSMSYADAFFPLLLMHGELPKASQWYSHFWLFLTVGVFYLAAILLVREVRTRTAVAVLCLALVAMPLQGYFGVVLSPALIAATLFLGWRSLRGEGGRGRATAYCLLAAACVALLLVGTFFVGRSVVEKPLQAGVVGALWRVPTAFGLGFGPLDRFPSWLPVWLPGATVIGLSLLGILCLIRAWRNGTVSIERVAGLLLALAGASVVPVAIGVARTEVNFHLAWYAPMTAPVLCLVFLLWSVPVYARLGGLVQMCLFSFVCVTGMYHLAAGTDFGITRRAAWDAYRKDVENGIPVSGIAARHMEYWTCPASSLEQFRQTGPPQYRAIQPDPEWQVEDYGSEAVSSELLPPVRGDKKEARRTRIVVRLPRPRFLYLVQVMVAPVPEQAPVTYWLDTFSVARPEEDGDTSLPESGTGHFVFRYRNGAVVVKPVWVGQEADRFEMVLRSRDGGAAVRGIQFLMKPESSTETGPDNAPDLR